MAVVQKEIDGRVKYEMEGIGFDEKMLEQQRLITKAAEQIEEEQQEIKDIVDREIMNLPSLKNQA